MCVQLSPRAVAARAPIRSRRPNNSSTRERSPRPNSTSLRRRLSHDAVSVSRLVDDAHVVATRTGRVLTQAWNSRSAESVHAPRTCGSASVWVLGGGNIVDAFLPAQSREPSQRDSSSDSNAVISAGIHRAPFAPSRAYERPLRRLRWLLLISGLGGSIPSRRTFSVRQGRGNLGTATFKIVSAPHMTPHMLSIGP